MIHNEVSLFLYLCQHLISLALFFTFGKFDKLRGTWQVVCDVTVYNYVASMNGSCRIHKRERCVVFQCDLLLGIAVCFGGNFMGLGLWHG